MKREIIASITSCLAILLIICISWICNDATKNFIEYLWIAVAIVTIVAIITIILCIKRSK